MFQTASASDDGDATTGGGFGAGGGGYGTPQAMKRTGHVGTALIGTNARRRMSGLPFDPKAVRQSDVPEVYATSNARLSARETASAADKMLRVAGLESATLERKMAFIAAVRLGHVLNSASQLVPRRAELGFEGSVVYNYHTNVMAVLGEDARRYFRYEADEIVLQLKALFENEALLSGAQLEIVHMVRAVAEERGLGRMPWFAFDAADYVTNEVSTAAERVAIRAAKNAVVSSTDNEVDNVVPVALQAATMAASAGRAPAAVSAGRPAHYGARVNLG